MWRSSETACGCFVQTGPDPLGLALAAVLGGQPFSPGPDVEKGRLSSGTTVLVSLLTRWF